MTTDLGDIDLMGEIAGFSSYEEVAAASETLELYGVSCRILSLEGLIRTKRAAGRPKTTKSSSPHQVPVGEAA